MDDIVYLEPDEEITSAIDKLKELKPEIHAVSLVIPKGSAILQSVVNLKLLKKESIVLSKDLSIVTQDRIGRNLASQAGFTVFDNINSPRPIADRPKPEPKTEEIIDMDMTENNDVPEVSPSGIAVHRYDNSYNPSEDEKPLNSNIPIEETKNIPPKMAEIKPIISAAKPDFKTNNSSFKVEKPKVGMSKKKKIILAIISILILAGGVLFYFFYPKSIITLAVKSEPIDANIEVLVDNNINVNDDVRHAIPGELLEAEQQGGKKFTATGKKEAGEKAKGTITTSNDSGDVQKVSSGTEYKADSGLIFTAAGDTNIPGATASVDSHGNVVKIAGKADVSVEASEAGDKYNVGPSSFTVLGKAMLSGKSANPMSGGISKEITIVSQNDLNAAKSELETEIVKTLHENLKTQAGKNKIYDSSIKDEVVSTESTKNAGDETSDFEMKLKIKSKVISFDENTFREMVVKFLEKNIPSDKTLSLSTSDEISVTSSETDTKTGILTLKGNVKTKTIPKIDMNSLKQSLKGKNSADAEAIAKKIPDVESVKIEYMPSWLIKKVPSRDKNIIINFDFK